MRFCPVASRPHQGHAFIQSSTPRRQCGQVPSKYRDSFHICGSSHQGQNGMGYITPPPQLASHFASKRNPRGAFSGTSLECPFS